MNETQDTQIEHFPDRSLRRLLQDREYVRGLVQIIAPGHRGVSRLQSDHIPEKKFHL